MGGVTYLSVTLLHQVENDRPLLQLKPCYILNIKCISLDNRPYVLLASWFGNVPTTVLLSKKLILSQHSKAFVISISHTVFCCCVRSLELASLDVT